MSETEAIERAQAGESDSFEALYGLHKRRVYSLCLRMTGNTAEAEDLTQEAFLQLYRKIATFRGESAFSTWLHRLAVNVVLMHLRKGTARGLPARNAGTGRGRWAEKGHRLAGSGAGRLH
jgi:RNA polymerase sigma-70 factor (ECF subfamily)